MTADHVTEMPAEIGRAPEGQLKIVWKDGHVSVYESRALRWNCPCAVCVEEMTGKRVITMESIPADIRPVGVSVAGRYALRIAWSDAHDTGLYLFTLLRALCPCCRKST